MAKKVCSIDGKMVGFLNRTNLKDGIICDDCAKKVVGDPSKMSNMNLLGNMTVKDVKSVLNGNLSLEDFQQEQNQIKAENKAAKKKKTAQTLDRWENEADARQQAKQAAKAPHCPKCGSTNLQIIGNHHKGFSVGKAIVGGVLTAGTGVGVLAGFAGKKGKRVDMICMNCGKKFKY